MKIHYTSLVRAGNGGRAYEDILNYDVRMLIYSFLPLPPMWLGTNCSGIILSCKAANREVREAAARQVNASFQQFRTDLKRVTGLEAQVSDVPLVGSWEN